MIQVWQVNPGRIGICFGFFSWFFFKLMLQNWVDWILCFVIFLFVFYRVIMVLWQTLWVSPTVLGCFCLFFKKKFQFYPLILSWLGIRLHNLFQFAFLKVISTSWLGSWVWMINLTRVVFSCPFFNWFFFISSFNIGLIGNWAS